METVIDGYHIQIMPKNDEWMVFPNKSTFAFFMEWDKQLVQWKFKPAVASKVPKEDFEKFQKSEKKISDFIEASRKHGKKRAENYEPKVSFDGTFEDMIGISVKDAEKKIKEKKEKKDD